MKQIRLHPHRSGYCWARLVFSGQASPPFRAPDAKTALELVAGNPNAIAYVAYADTAALGKKVRIVLELDN